MVLFQVRLKGVLLNWKNTKMTFQLAACAEMLQPHNPIHWRAARFNELGYNFPVGMEAFARTKNKTRLKCFMLH
jgi:hydroxypyruvate isomerase